MSHVEVVKEFGDPDLLVYEEDLVLFKLQQPWPSSRPLPKNCTIVDDGSQRTLSTSTKGLVSASNVLKTAGITGALFSGCVALPDDPPWIPDHRKWAMLGPTHTTKVNHFFARGTRRVRQWGGRHRAHI